MPLLELLSQSEVQPACSVFFSFRVRFTCWEVGCWSGRPDGLHTPQQGTANFYVKSDTTSSTEMW